MMPDDASLSRRHVPADRCMRWHGLDVWMCECMETDGVVLKCPPCARHPLSKLTNAQVAAALATNLDIGLTIQKEFGKATQAAVARQLAGEFCPDCFSPNVRWAGTCKVCGDCGSMSGGCS